MGYSVHFDWSEELKESDKWTNHGIYVAEDSCKHKTQDTREKENRETNIRYSGYCEECEISENSQQPMMNYGYPLNSVPEEEKIKKIIHNTCLTVMENENTGEVYLVLCGGGMDLSQNIAYAYILAEEPIPFDLAVAISTQEGLNFSGKVWRKIMRECKRNIKNNVFWGNQRIKEINNSLKQSKKKEKEKEMK